jgi:hypothetical protein
MEKKPEDNEEKTYEVKDKRRVNADGSLKEEAEQEPTAQPVVEEPQVEAAAEPEAGPAEEQPAGEAAQEEDASIPPPDVYAMLGFIIGLMADTAWQLMGLRLAPGQKEQVKDIAQAKIAIDTIVFIADKLHPKLSEEERKSIRGLISDLQINYVRMNQ